MTDVKTQLRNKMNIFSIFTSMNTKPSITNNLSNINDIIGLAVNETVGYKSGSVHVHFNKCHI